MNESSFQITFEISVDGLHLITIDEWPGFKFSMVRTVMKDNTVRLCDPANLPKTIAHAVELAITKHLSYETIPERA